jgi:hypothetical protein
LKVHDRINRARFRLKRYGGLLYTMDFAARRARLRWMRDWTSRKIQEIDIQYIK